MGRDISLLLVHGPLDAALLVATAREVLGADFAHSLVAMLADRELGSKKDGKRVPVTALCFRSEVDDADALRLSELASALSRRLGMLLYAFSSDHGGTSGWAVIEEGFAVEVKEHEDESMTVRVAGLKRVFGVSPRGLDFEALADDPTRAVRLGPSEMAGTLLAPEEMRTALEERDAFYAPRVKEPPPDAHTLLEAVLALREKNGVEALRPYLEPDGLEVVFAGERATTPDAALALLEARLPREKLNIYELPGDELRRRKSRKTETDTCAAPVAAASKPWKPVWDVGVTSKHGKLVKLVFTPKA